MTNALKGYTEVQAGGKPLPLRFTLGTLAVAEQRLSNVLGEPITTNMIFSEKVQGRLTALRELFVLGACKANSDLRQDDAYDLFDEVDGGFQVLNSEIMTAVGACLRDLTVEQMKEEVEDITEDGTKKKRTGTGTSSSGSRVKSG